MHGEFWGFFYCLSCSLKVLQVVLLCCVEEVKNKVRRKSRKVVSQRLTDFLLPAPFLSPTNGIGESETLMKNIKYLRLQDLIIEIFSVICQATWCVLLSIQNKTRNCGPANTPLFDNLPMFLLLRSLKGFKTK